MPRSTRGEQSEFTFASALPAPTLCPRPLLPGTQITSGLLVSHSVYLEYKQSRHSSQITNGAPASGRKNAFASGVPRPRIKLRLWPGLAYQMQSSEFTSAQAWPVAGGNRQDVVESVAQG